MVSKPGVRGRTQCVDHNIQGSKHKAITIAHRPVDYIAERSAVWRGLHPIAWRNQQTILPAQTLMSSSKRKFRKWLAFEGVL